jgi:hypothetical protein
MTLNCDLLGRKTVGEERAGSDELQKQELSPQQLYWFTKKRRRYVRRK